MTALTSTRARALRSQRGSFEAFVAVVSIICILGFGLFVWTGPMQAKEQKAQEQAGDTLATRYHLKRDALPLRVWPDARFEIETDHAILQCRVGQKADRLFCKTDGEWIELSTNTAPSARTKEP